MATRLVGVDDLNPTLPAGVIVASTATPEDTMLDDPERLVSAAGLRDALPRLDIRGFAEGVGTGDPAIDHAAIVGTDAEVAANGGTLWLPGGIWDIEDVSLTKAPHTVWEGVKNNPITGVPGTRINYSGEAEALIVDGDGDSTNKRGQIIGMRFAYTGAAGVATTSTGIRIQNGAQDHHLEDVFVANFAFGIDVDNSSAQYMRHIYTVSCKNTGVRFTDCTDSIIEGNSQMSGLSYGVHAIRTSSLQLHGARPQSSGIANIKVEDTGFFKMTGGFCDSAQISAGAGDHMGVHLVNVNYCTITGTTFYANSTVVDILLETTAGETMLTFAIVGTTHNTGGGDKVAVICRSAGTMRRGTIAPGAVDNLAEPIVRFEPPSGAGVYEYMTIGPSAGGGGVQGAQHVTTELNVQGVNKAPMVAGPIGAGVVLTKRALVHGPAVYSFPGTNGNYVSTPSDSTLNPTGDICIVAKIAPADWTPAANYTIASKYHSTGDQRSWEFILTTAGALNWSYSTDGVTMLSRTSTANLSAQADGATLWVAITHDVDNGASSNSVRFWTSPDGVTWTQLGSTVTSGAAAASGLFASTASLELSGVVNGTARPYAGKIYSLSFRNGMGASGAVGGTEVASYDGTIPGMPDYRDNYGHLWTPTATFTGTADLKIVPA